VGMATPKPKVGLFTAELLKAIDDLSAIATSPAPDQGYCPQAGAQLSEMQGLIATVKAERDKIDEFGPSRKKAKADEKERIADKQRDRRRHLF